MSKLMNKYINRELSWIEFNRRVLQEAEDSNNPLLERVKFLGIVSSNLDEFVSVRVAGIQDQVKLGHTREDFTGYTPSSLSKRVNKKIKEMVQDQYRIYREILKTLNKEGIHIKKVEELTATQQQQLEDYYFDIVFPVLTPMAVDQSRPFPHLHTKEIYLAVALKNEQELEDEEPYFAIVQVPSILSRIIPVPARSNSKKQEFVLLEDLIRANISTLFNGFESVAVSAFRLTRNADLSLDEEGAEDLLEEIEKELRRRKWGSPVRLEIEKDSIPFLTEMLYDEHELDDDCVYQIENALDLSCLLKLPSLVHNFNELRDRKHDAQYPDEFETDDIMEVLREKDVVLHHPYESYEPVNEFVWEAAKDPNVLAIKMTMYRVSGQSPLVKALEYAAANGKQVTAVVELKARFDEERNIAWAKQLEKAGCHVVYGLVGLKIHAKLLLVVRREKGQVRRYVHVGTGNYNENTAKLYTDISLMTSNDTIGSDASDLFNEMTGYSSPRNWEAFAVAPTGLMNQLVKLIDREIEHAKLGRPARIIAKMNSLSNQIVADKLYEASTAGVKIDLIVRGVCCLRPGIPQVSENINVISIVDRFLEHSRITYFYNNGEEELFLSSADWMTRNLTKRIELMCPIFDKKVKQTMLNILEYHLKDNVKARKLLTNGQYMKVKPIENAEYFRSQVEFQSIKSWKVRQN